MGSLYKSAVFGSLVGDALGVSFEFKYPKDIPSHELINMFMPASFLKSHSRVPFGVWSDDGSQLLCLLEVLYTKDDFDPEMFGKLLLKWLMASYHQSGGVVFDCGIQTSYALRLLEAGTEPLKAGSTLESNNGNGSLMRTLPVAIVGHLKKYSIEKIINIAHLHSRVTHGHSISQACCALYSLVAFDLLDNKSKLVSDCVLDARSKLERFYAEGKNKDGLVALEKVTDYPKANNLRGSGYVVDTFWTAIDCVQKSKTYMDAVRFAIGFGNDTDTTACVAGGLAGIIYGMDERSHESAPLGIPADWVGCLNIPNETKTLLHALINEDSNGN